MTQASTPEDWLSAYLDGELEDAERAEVERALRDDAELRRLHEDLVRMRGLLHSLPEVSPRLNLSGAVGHAIERRALSTARAATPAARIRRRDRGIRKWPTWAVVAATAAASVSLTWIVVESRNRRGADAEADRSVAVLELPETDSGPTGAEAADAAARISAEASHVEEFGMPSALAAADDAAPSAPQEAGGEGAGAPQVMQLQEQAQAVPPHDLPGSAKKGNDFRYAQRGEVDTSQLSRELALRGQVDVICSGDDEQLGKMLLQLATAGQRPMNRQLAMGRTARPGVGGGGFGSIPRPSDKRSTSQRSRDRGDVRQEAGSEVAKPAAPTDAATDTVSDTASDTAKKRQAELKKSLHRKTQTELEIADTGPPTIVIRGSREEIEQKIQWLLEHGFSTASQIELDWLRSRQLDEPEKLARGAQDGNQQRAFSAGGFAGGGAPPERKPQPRRRAGGDDAVGGAAGGGRDQQVDRPSPRAGKQLGMTRLRLRFVVEDPGTSLPETDSQLEAAPSTRGDRDKGQKASKKPAGKDED